MVVGIGWGTADILVPQQSLSPTKVRHPRYLITILLPDSRWAPRLEVGTFYYGCFQKYREIFLHLEVSVVNN